MDVLLVSLTDIGDEMRTLVRTAGHRIVHEVVQRRPEAPKTFVGRGKLEELEDIVRDREIEAVVVNGDVRPPQHYRLEKALGVECFDRTRIILEVFIQQAHTREAKLQVELALLQYEVPILREWVHRAAHGERPGFMAGGEYRVDAYLETVKRKIRKVKGDLERIREDRARRRSRRQERGFHLIGIGGYANAGKSSLLNALTGAHVLVEDRMFSTLSTTTRSLPEGRPKVLLTDTVGFIDAVPLWLIEAFHATLE
jgi:GTP-binding protein HflX